MWRHLADMQIRLKGKNIFANYQNKYEQYIYLYFFVLSFLGYSYFFVLSFLGFSHVSSLVVHRRRVHEQVKPFLCSQCPRSFYTSTSLKSHSTVHSTAKRYRCKVHTSYFKAPIGHICDFSSLRRLFCEKMAHVSDWKIFCYTILCTFCM